MSSPLSLAGLVVVLDQLGLDVFSQRVIIFGRPVSQDAGGELVLWVTGTTQDHLHHLLTGPGTDGGTDRDIREDTELYPDENMLVCVSLTSLCGAAAADRTRPLDVLKTQRQDKKKSQLDQTGGQMMSPGH